LNLPTYQNLAADTSGVCPPTPTAPATTPGVWG